MPLPMRDGQGRTITTMAPAKSAPTTAPRRARPRTERTDPGAAGGPDLIFVIASGGVRVSPGGAHGGSRAPSGKAPLVAIAGEGPGGE